MDPIPESYVEPLQWFSDYLKTALKADSTFDVSIVQKGLTLYQQGSVSQISFENDAVFGRVEDTELVKVKLDLTSPHASECTYLEESICPHQMALFFQLLSHGSSVSAWIDEWRKTTRGEKTLKDLGLKRAKDLLPSTEHQQPDYNTWVESFREDFDAIMEEEGKPRPYFIPERFSTFLSRMQKKAPLKKEWKDLYLLIGSIIAFEQLLLLSKELEHNEETIDRYYRYIFQNLLDELEELSYRLSIQSLPFSFDDFMEKLKLESLHLLTIQSDVDYERIHLFRLLWTDLFKEKNWREAMKEELASHSDSSFSILVGTIHLQLLLGQDEEASSLMKECDEDITPYFLYWLEILPAKRMDTYISLFISFIKDYLNHLPNYYACRQFVQMGLKAMTPFFHRYERSDLYEKALISMLPFSFHDYEHFLFDQKAYEKWMELQTYLGLQFESISKEQIKLLQTEAPAVLLPLYHQAIQTDLNGKSRSHYKQAVRKLKKLRTIYKKMKRQEDFNEYFDILLTRTKRLRAFHEECKRGKLIDA